MNVQNSDLSEDEHEGSESASPDTSELDVERFLLAGGAWALFGRGGETVLVLLETALLARLLAPTDMGTYFLALSLVVAVGNLGMFGLGQTAIRLIGVAGIAGKGELAARIVQRVVIYGSAGAGSAGLLVALGMAGLFRGGSWGSERVLELTYSIGFLTALWTLRRVLAETLRGFGDIRLASLFSRLSVTTVTVLLYLGLWYGVGSASLSEVVGILILSSAVSCVAAAFFVAGKVRALNRGGVNEPLPPILRGAWPVFLNTVVSMVIAYLSLWLLGALGDQDSVAEFGAALKLSAAVLAPLPIVNAVLAPLIAGLYASGRISQLEKVLQICGGLVLAAGSVAGLVLIGFGRQILVLLYGPFYAGASIALLVLTTASLASLVSGSCVVTLVQTGHQGTLLRVTLAVAAADVVVGWFLVSRFGLVGAALTAGLGLVLQSFACWFAVRLALGIWTHATFVGWRSFFQGVHSFRRAE